MIVGVGVGIFVMMTVGVLVMDLVGLGVNLHDDFPSHTLFAYSIQLLVGLQLVGAPCVPFVPS